MDAAFDEYDGVDEHYLATCGADKGDRLQDLQSDAEVLAAMDDLDAAAQILLRGRETLFARLSPYRPRVRRAETKFAELRAPR